MNTTITIDGTAIGPQHPTYVIAELSANHQGSLDNTLALMDAAKASGANAIKIQSYTADSLTLDSDGPHFVLPPDSPWAGYTLHGLYAEAALPYEWVPDLKAHAAALGITFFSTPFDPHAVDFLEDLGVPAYKVASFEINDLGLIAKVASTGKPMILSTGMAALTEIQEAVDTFHDNGGTEVALLKCTSAYPAPPSAIHLNTLAHLGETFQVPVGLSDHTLGHHIPIAACAKGARIIEKHFTLSREVEGPDSHFSMEPDEFATMVRSIREVEAAFGGIHYGVSASETTSTGLRRSLFTTKPIRKGEAFTNENIRSVRPGNGLPPKHLPLVLGRVCTVDLDFATPLDWTHIGALATEETP